ncbi:hypothetical protein [Vibrio crassostreae]
MEGRKDIKVALSAKLSLRVVARMLNRSPFNDFKRNCS